VRHWPHDHVVNLVRRCRTCRFASLTLMTSRDNDATRRRLLDALLLQSPPSADPPQRINYNELYRQIYSPVPFADRCILTLVGEFHIRPMSEYLRGIAHRNVRLTC